MSKKVLSLLLALTLIFGVLPISAFADEPNTETETDIIDIVDTTDDTIDTTTTNGGGLSFADSGEDSCSCGSFCNDADCVICKDDATQCFYYYCICEAVCAEGEANPDCPVCKDDYSKCVQAVEVPEFAAMTAATPAVTIPVDGYVTSGNGKITISGLPSDGGIYVYWITPNQWTAWQNTQQNQAATMTMWSIWNASVDITALKNGTPLNNGTTYYVYIAKTELINSQYQMRSLGEAVVTLPPAPPPPSSGGGGGSSRPEPPAPVIVPLDDKSSGTLNTAITSAANTANSDGKTLDVKLKNVSNFTKDNAAAIIKKARELGKKAAVSSDIMSEDGKSVEVRVTLDPELIKKNVRLDGYTRQAETQMTESKFKRHFSNQVMVVTLGQEQSFGQTATVSLKLSPDKFDSINNLFFYSYDKKTNKYIRIERQSNHWIDKNGYLHFATELGGDIIISNGPLEKK